MRLSLPDHLRSIDKRRVRRVFGQFVWEGMAGTEGAAVLLGHGNRFHALGAPPVRDGGLRRARVDHFKHARLRPRSVVINPR